MDFDSSHQVAFAVPSCKVYAKFGFVLRVAREFFVFEWVGVFCAGKKGGGENSGEGFF